MTVCGVHDEAINAGRRQSSARWRSLVADRRRGGDARRPSLSLAAFGCVVAFSMSLTVTSPTQR